jgi:hypothetical protein
MSKRSKRNDDTLWHMLSKELQMQEVRELQGYLDGDEEHYEMGYGDLTIEPYDTQGGRSKMFRLRHKDYGQTIVSHAALRSVLHDLSHYLISVQRNNS